MTQLLTLNIADTIAAIAACAKGNVTPIVFGPPGIGKTSILELVAKACDLELQVVVGGTLADRDDIAGTPYVAGGDLRWSHRKPIRAAIERPCLLAVDEYTTTPEQAGGALLSLLLDRRAGDTPLHPDTRIVCLANPQEHAPGARRIMPAEANRLGFLTMRPAASEVTAWFAKRPEVHLAEFGVLANHHVDWLQMEPPASKIEAGQTWGSPRAWERGLRAFAACQVGFSGGKEHKVGHATLSAFVGAELAGAYLAVRSQRALLPSFEEILADPMKASKSLDKRRTDVMLAALGATPAISNSDTGAAWVWAAQLPDRYLGAAVSALVNRDWVDGTHSHAGRKVQMGSLAKLAGQGTGF